LPGASRQRIFAIVAEFILIKQLFYLFLVGFWEKIKMKNTLNQLGFLRNKGNHLVS